MSSPPAHSSQQDQTITIEAAAAAPTTPLYMEGLKLTKLNIPSGWKATAGVYFKGVISKAHAAAIAAGSDTAKVIYDMGVAVAIPAGSGLASTIQEVEISGYYQIYLYSGAPGADVNQDSEVIVEPKLETHRR